jgi:2-haloacid dehalogenase
VADRWATFDCYGTLIDWNGGVGDVLARLFGEDRREDLLARYHELEPQVQRENPAESYREVMATVLEQLGADSSDRDALGKSLPSWRPFPEVRAALAEARERGWKLAILSNTDRDFIEASQRAIGVPFEFAIVASEIGSYKPNEGHWRAFRERAEPAAGSHVHVGASLFHDVEPSLRLEIPVVWINRLGEEPEPRPTRELSDLAPLPNTLDELVHG